MTPLPENLKELPSGRNHNCFGCSPINPSGLRMRFFTDGKAVYSRLQVPAHLCGWSNIVHGGVLTTILDEIMSWAAIRLLQRMESNPVTGMVSRITLDIQLPPDFPAKYREAVIRSAEQCAVKKHFEHPPAIEVSTSTAS